MIANLLTKIKSVMPFLLRLYVFPILLLAWVVYYHLKTGLPLKNFSWDPAMFVGIRPFYSIVTTVGGLFWCGTLVVCFFSWAVSRKAKPEDRISNYILYSGLLTVVLMLDDLFQIHEVLGGLNFSEKYLYLGYALCVAGIFFFYRETILKTDYLILVLTGAFLGFSILMDINQEYLTEIFGGWTVFAEDGFKFLGISGWFGYFLRTCYIEMVNLYDTVPTPPVSTVSSLK